MTTEAVKNQALQTCKLRPGGEGVPSEQFIAELAKLEESVGALTAEDLNLEDAVNSIPKSIQLDPTMRTFVEIFKNPDLTLIMIIMKPGSRIPLHDHPNMYGMIKVLAGQVRVQSYTLLDEPVKMDDQTPKVMSAIRMPESILTKTSSPITLSPDIGNVHEIECICGEAGGEYAAFFDIMSPSYPDEPNSCHYFQAEEDVQRADGSGDQPKFRLVHTECPEDFRTYFFKRPF